MSSKRTRKTGAASGWPSKRIGSTGFSSRAACISGVIFGFMDELYHDRCDLARKTGRPYRQPEKPAADCVAKETAGPGPVRDNANSAPINPESGSLSSGPSTFNAAVTLKCPTTPARTSLIKGEPSRSGRIGDSQGPYFFHVGPAYGRGDFRQKSC